MMKDLGASKQLIERAVKTLPDGSEFADIRAKMKTTLSMIETIEEKKDKRSRTGINAAQKWQLDLEQGRMVYNNGSNAKNALAAIEQMIETERKNLEDSKDDGNLGTILG